MKTRLSTLLLGSLLVLLPACKSPLQLYATRYSDMRSESPPRLTFFETNEQPALVVDLPQGCGWGEQLGTLRIDNALTGAKVWSESQFLREGYTHYFTPKNLVKGSYLVTLSAGGEARADTNFDIR